jgi:hypothetical protein
MTAAHQEKPTTPGKGQMAVTGVAPDAVESRAAATFVRRLINDSIAEAVEKFKDGDTKIFEFACECGDLRCRGFAKMTLREYRTTAPGSVLAHRLVCESQPSPS